MSTATVNGNPPHGTPDGAVPPCPTPRVCAGTRGNRPTPRTHTSRLLSTAGPCTHHTNAPQGNHTTVAPSPYELLASLASKLAPAWKSPSTEGHPAQAPSPAVNAALADILTELDLDVPTTEDAHSAAPPSEHTGENATNMSADSPPLTEQQQAARACAMAVHPSNGDAALRACEEYGISPVTASDNSDSTSPASTDAPALVSSEVSGTAAPEVADEVHAVTSEQASVETTFDTTAITPGADSSGVSEDSPRADTPVAITETNSETDEDETAIASETVRTTEDNATLWQRFVREVVNDRGMATLEYALVCLAAAAFAGLLYVIITSGAVEDALRRIFEDALNKR